MPRLLHSIETKRLTIREITQGDFPFLLSLLSDPIVLRYWPNPLDTEQVTAWIRRQLKRYEEDGFGYWLVLHKGSPIGQAGVCLTDVEGVREPGLGYIFANTARGQGFATEAASACRDWGHEVLGSERVVALVRPENTASAKVTQRLGMKLEKQVDYAGFRHDVFVSTRTPAKTI